MRMWLPFEEAPHTLHSPQDDAQEPAEAKDKAADSNVWTLFVVWGK